MQNLTEAQGAKNAAAKMQLLRLCALLSVVKVIKPMSLVGKRAAARLIESHVFSWAG